MTIPSDTTTSDTTTSDTTTSDTTEAAPAPLVRPALRYRNPPTALRLLTDVLGFRVSAAHLPHLRPAHPSATVRPPPPSVHQRPSGPSLKIVAG